MRECNVALSVTIILPSASFLESPGNFSGPLRLFLVKAEICIRLKLFL